MVMYVVDAIGFQIGDNVAWFSGTGGVTSEIKLACNEYVTHISGSEGYFTVSEQRHVTSLTIHTNVCPRGYGPFGSAQLVNENSSFTTPFVEDNVVVGFSGRVGTYLDSIAVTSKSRITHGPFGGEGLQNWCIESERAGRIKKVMIKHGNIVDGIGFEIVNNMKKSFTVWFSGPGGETSEVNLGKTEYIRQISGTHGCWNNSSSSMITSLKIHTNVCPQGYGPFGDATGVYVNLPFTTNLPGHHSITSFSGRVGDYLHSITAYSTPVGFLGKIGEYLYSNSADPTSLQEDEAEDMEGTVDG